MATRGPKPKPELARYCEAGDAPGIYVLEVGESIKVGRAQTLTGRLKALHTIHRRRGEVIGRFTVFPQPTDDLYAIECDAIHAMQSVADSLPGCREYFSGITFEHAVSVVGYAITA